MKLNTITTLLLVSFATSAVGAELTTFQSGDYIEASKMNENFQYLIDKMEDAGSKSGAITYDVDCSTEPTQLTTFMEHSHTADFIIVQITGDCEWTGGEANRGQMMFTKHPDVISASITNAYNSPIHIDRPNIGFTYLDVPYGFHYDGGGSGWVEGVTFNADSWISVDGNATLAINSLESGTNLDISNSSRVWLSQDTDFNELIIANNSVFNTNSRVTANYIGVKNNSYLTAPEITAYNEIIVRRGSIISSDVITTPILALRENGIALADISITASTNLYMDMGAGIKTEAVSVGTDGFRLAQGAKVRVTSIDSDGPIEAVGNSNIDVQSITAPKFDLHGGSTLYAEELTVDSEIYLEQNSSAEVDNITATNLTLRTGSSIDAEVLTISGNIYAEGRSTLSADDVYTNTMGLYSSDMNVWNHFDITNVAEFAWSLGAYSTLRTPTAVDSTSYDVLSFFCNSRDDYPMEFMYFESNGQYRDFSEGTCNPTP
ncbi:hypothetical protein AB4113_14390 [Vibrio breoganii]